jgi:hypothetical protein
MMAPAKPHTYSPQVFISSSGIPGIKTMWKWKKAAIPAAAAVTKKRQAPITAFMVNKKADICHDEHTYSEAEFLSLQCV